MVWIVEVPPRRTNPGHLVRIALRAEIRHLWWLQLAVLGAGLGVWALLLAVTENTPTNPRAGGEVFVYLNSLVLSVFPMLLTASGLTGSGDKGRVGLWLQLPLSRRAVNQIRTAGLAWHIWPIVLTWPPLLLLLHDVYGPVPAWTVVNAFLLVALGVALSLRTHFAALAVFLYMPLQTALGYFIPGGEPLAAAWSRVMASYWGSLALLVLVAGCGARGWTMHPPRGSG